jgi:hypothetical protein
MSADSISLWRQAAVQFHAIRAELAAGNLPDQFDPGDLEALEREPRTGAIKAVFAFLLHTWDCSCPFDLFEIKRWDKHHRSAFAAWVDGKITGEPCHYF